MLSALLLFLIGRFHPSLRAKDTERYETGRHGIDHPEAADCSSFRLLYSPLYCRNAVGKSCTIVATLSRVTSR